MSSHDPDRVTVAEINDLLSECLTLSRAGASASIGERLAYHERKADLLSRIAAEQDTAHAHATAATAREQLIELRAKAHRAQRTEQQTEAGNE